MTQRGKIVGGVLGLLLLVVLALILFGGGVDPGQGTLRPSSPTATARSSPTLTSTPASSASPRPRPSASATAGTRDPETGLRWADLDQLPREAGETVELIRRSGPFRYGQDGGTFGNRERILPRKSSGYYREYTVPTPGSEDRGARRIVTGDDDRQLFYTGDHYATFVRIRR